ncbi:alpha/beta hydrolase [Neptuniibacter sp.]|uniref:alpha/beta fold hydrolase n=1 Tax=Neptuniibacter sp. TaxID=1962643 RepID=UPI00263158F6|nr:alpha/beta hydrolase [Neptuniibacter sp.]MCP4596387.1 alpha/beta fold hydrolase [Neptuniibacter sp.]
MSDSPEIANMLDLGDIQVNYHDQGQGKPVILLHGSGAGVTAWANWRNAIPMLSEFRRVLAPDLVGFGYTESPADYEYKHLDTWVDQIIRFMDALDIEKADFVGNSFGGSLSLRLAVEHPKRIGRIVLMGSGGQPFEVSPELAKLWGYKPSMEAMKEILGIMAFDQSIATDELAEMRYNATMRPGFQERFERVFPPPYQRWADAQVVSDEDLANLDNEVLIIHGRDDRVVPVQISENLFRKIKNAQMHLFGNCGHWTQIEQTARFNSLVLQFLQED